MQLAVCYGVASVGALWYFRFHKDATADLSSKPRDIESGTACKQCVRQYFFTTYLPESVCGIKGEGAPALALAFLGPLFWVLEVFW